MTGEQLVQALAAELGLPPLGDDQIGELLALAGTAAHGSERLAAPLCTYLTGRSGRDPAEVHALVRSLTEGGPG